MAILVPFLNEAESLPTLIRSLRNVIEDIPREFEVVLIDDGSRDDSVAAAGQAIDGDPRFRVISLQANYGKSAAIAAGLDHTTAEVVITMDADMQDPPAAIPRFLACIDNGDELVAGWRQQRKEPLYRRAFSAAFNTSLRFLGRIPVHDMNCGLKAYRRTVLESIHMSRGMHRFTILVAAGHGFRIAEVPVDHQPRHAGASKYGLWRYFETACGLLTALYVRRPQRSPMSTLSLAGAVLLLGAAGAAIAMAILGTSGFGPWLGAATTGLLGSQLLICGMVGELILQRIARSELGPPYILKDRPPGPS